MVEERGRDMQRDQAEQQEADGLMHRQELPVDRAIATDQRRELAEEEQVHAVAVRVGL
jgi:hypothetical protein